MTRNKCTKTCAFPKVVVSLHQKKKTKIKLNPKTRKGREIMTRNDFITTMKAQVEILKAERLDAKKLAAKDDNAYYRFNKLGHEISAIENAIREMERV